MQAYHRQRPDGQALAYVYFEDEPGRRSAAEAIDPANCRKTNEVKGSGRENVTPHEGDLPANHCNEQFRAAGKYQPVPVHRPVK